MCICFAEYQNLIAYNRWRAWLPDDPNEVNQQNDEYAVQPDWLISMDSEIDQKQSDAVIYLYALIFGLIASIQYSS